MAAIPKRRLIGVLGGMGPLATIDFLSKVARHTPARRDQDHVPMIVHAVPQIPDRSAAIATGDDAPFLPLLAGLRMLADAGAEAIAMPCNSAHHWFARLAGASRVDMIHIADAVADDLSARTARPRSLALLATEGAIRAGFYQERLSPLVERLIVPDAALQARIDNAIRLVKAGEIGAARAEAGAAAKDLRAEGADALLLACTELPIAVDGDAAGLATLDATDALARACVARSLATEAAAPRAEALA